MTRARAAVAGRFAESWVARRSAFADAVLLVASELVTNVLRHAPHSPCADAGITAVRGTLVISVEDTEPRLPELSGEGMGAGPRRVSELAAEYGGEVSVEPATRHTGKTVLVRFEIPCTDHPPMTGERNR
ncbi:ATP-binding protein [Streptomyces sp. NPDC058195]|uniref:ATP-binding protein n=1 Tax=Streptomyces sp. NPDC058195 TaxID=3346375 RepID=UPI0036E8D71B